MRAGLLALLAVACGRETSLAQHPTGPALEQAAEHAERAGVHFGAGTVQAYRWQGRGRVPIAASVSTREVAVPWGELGVLPETRVYLPAHAGASLVDCSGGDVAVEAQRIGGTRGRFGGGLDLGRDSTLTIGRRGPSASPELFAEPFVLEFHLRPKERGVRRHVLSLPEFASLVLDESEHLNLKIETDPPLWLESDGVLRDGWNHVALVHGGLPMHPFRLVLNGVAAQRVVESGSPPGPAEQLLLGGRGRGVPGLAMDVDEISIRSRALATGELIAEQAPPAPGFRTLQLERAAGIEEQKHWFGVLDAVPSSSSDWAQGELRHVVVEDDGLRWVPGDWERDLASGSPPPRTAHAGAFLGDHRILVFGGEARDSHVNPQINTDDTWIYHTQRKAWEPVLTSPRPPARCHTPAAYSASHDLVLLCGGLLNGQYVQNRSMEDTWGFHVGEGRWSLLDPNGTLPRFSDAPLVYHERAGLFVMVLYDRVFVYSPERDHWTRLPQATTIDVDGGTVEYAPGGSAMALYEPASARILLFGGAVMEDGGKRYQAETAWYDLATNTFTVEKHESAPSPRVRSGFALDPVRRHVVLFGGVQGQHSEREADLWVYDLDGGGWSEIESANAPSARGGYYGMSFDPLLDRFFLVCGRHSLKRFLNEVWRLAVDREATGIARYVFERGVWDGASRGVVEWTPAAGPAPGLRYSWSTGDGVWSEWSDAMDAATEGAELLAVELSVAPGTSVGRLEFSR